MNENDLLRRCEVLDLIKLIVAKDKAKNDYAKGWNDCANYLMGAVTMVEADVPITVVKKRKR